jgi:hypothetical protein
MLEKLNQESFAEHLKTEFRVQFEDSPALVIELIKVSDLGSSAQQEQFSLLFRGPCDPIFQQGMRQLEHDRMGTLDLFLVPVGRDQEGTYYEAVFNRLRR